MTALATAADLGDDAVYEIADLIEAVMETKPVGYGWTPSEIGKKAKIDSGKVRMVLGWMVEHVYVISDDRGAWSHFYRRY